MPELFVVDVDDGRGEVDSECSEEQVHRVLDHDDASEHAVGLLDEFAQGEASRNDGNDSFIVFHQLIILDELLVLVEREVKTTKALHDHGKCHCE